MIRASAIVTEFLFTLLSENKTKLKPQTKNQNKTIGMKKIKLQNFVLSQKTLTCFKANETFVDV